MSQSPGPADLEQSGARRADGHRLELIEVDLIGGGRQIPFRPGLNIIQGDITTGKTTLVRLIRALLGTMPSALPPEVDYIRALRGQVTIGSRTWQIYRPRTTTAGALVEISEEDPDPNHEPIALRLPVAGTDRSYSLFLLDQLGLPAISVPQARNQPTGTLTPVTMTDWLGYCIITGDEIDTEVFGHHRDWRNIKRRWVFELAFGYYEPELAVLNARLRSIDLQLASLEQDAAIRAKFLAETPFADAGDLEAQLAARDDDLRQVIAQRRAIGVEADEVPGVQELRQTLLATRARLAEASDSLARLSSQITDLTDLQRQLSNQSARLTRAIVADEWLVDFDFIVCPRCGNDVNAGRTNPAMCYLCLQEPRPAQSRTHLLAEQDRITSQISETADVIAARRAAREQLCQEQVRLEEVANALATDLDQRTEAFVSDRASRIEHYAAEQARLEAEIRRLREYLELLQRHRHESEARTALEAQAEEITAQINSRELSQVDAEANVRALEQRMLEYLRDLNIPDLGEELSVKINRATYLPEVSGRTFDELSSQGLKTLVNIAHSLAHHTVAIDRKLPMPGLLILDGISANAGHEGFDQERVRDVYQLMSAISENYREALQLIAVDNYLSTAILLEVAQDVALTLNQADRLIRIPPATASDSAIRHQGSPS